MNKYFFMNYAEGQGAPTVKYDDEETAIKDAERLADELGVEVTTLKAVALTCPKDITKRVKTYADACAVLDIEPVVDEALLKSGFAKDEIAYRKLKTIAEALNEGWRPDWTDSNEYKYWPLFTYNANTAGFGYAYTASSASYTGANVDSRICFRTRELAVFASETFESIYNDFFLAG
jgi:hypothetical protein